MKRITILLWLSMCIGQLSADNYKVILVNDANLKFTNGKLVHKGDVFSDVKDIAWEKEKQAVKVINMSTKKPMLFVGKEWVKKTGVSVLYSESGLSTHDGGDGTSELTLYERLRPIFAEEYNMLDSVEVDTDLDLTGGNHSVNSVTTSPLDVGGVVKNIFGKVRKELDPKDVTLSIDYIDGASGLVIFVKDNIKLFVFPGSL